MKQIICDGCNVKSPHEHRCHGKDRITVLGEPRNSACECEACNKQPTAASLAAWADAGHPNEFEFEYETL